MRVVIRYLLRRGRLVISALTSAYAPAAWRATHALTATAWICTAALGTLPFIVLQHSGRPEELIDSIHGALDHLELVMLLLARF